VSKEPKAAAPNKRKRGPRKESAPSNENESSLEGVAEDDNENSMSNDSDVDDNSDDKRDKRYLI